MRWKWFNVRRFTMTIFATVDGFTNAMTVIVTNAANHCKSIHRITNKYSYERLNFSLKWISIVPSLKFGRLLNCNWFLKSFTAFLRDSTALKYPLKITQTHFDKCLFLFVVPKKIILLNTHTLSNLDNVEI